MGTGRNLTERKSAGLVGQSRQAQLGQLNLGAFQQATGASVADVAGNRAGCGEHGRRNGAEDEEEQGKHRGAFHRSSGVDGIGWSQQISPQNQNGVI